MTAAVADQVAGGTTRGTAMTVRAGELDWTVSADVQLSVEAILNSPDVANGAWDAFAPVTPLLREES